MPPSGSGPARARRSRVDSESRAGTLDSGASEGPETHHRLDAANMDDPFDRARASFPTRVVPTARVLDLLQVTHDPEGVLAYQKAMLAGARFPPIAVVHFAGRYIIADGHKRFSAFLALAADEIVVEVWPWRRVAGDLFRQATRWWRRLWHVTVGSSGGTAAHRETRRFLRDTAVHLGRMVRSVWARLRLRG